MERVGKNYTGVGVIEQLSSAGVWSDYVQKAGYYFPDGI